MGAGLAAPLLSDGERRLAVWGAVLLIYAVGRTIWPIGTRGGLRTLVAVLVEVAIHVAAVNATDYWDSPYVLSLVNAVVVAGFVRGFGFALRVSIASALCVIIPFALGPADATAVRDDSLPWVAVLMTVAIIAGYARTVFGVVIARDDEMSRLMTTNALLAELQRITQRGGDAFDTDAVILATRERLRAGVDARTTVILLCDGTGQVFRPLHAEGVRVGDEITLERLPDAAREAIESGRTVVVDQYDRDRSAGFDIHAQSGLYSPLTTRAGPAGVIALEDPAVEAFDADVARMVASVSDTTGIALDNALRFSRLRAAAAHEERTRIARDLHDRLGQSLAYVAFELDRLAAKVPESLADDLATLRLDVRKVVTEVRETLYDLRTDITDDTDIEDALASYGPRVKSRSGVDLVVDVDVDERMPRGVEHELWRIIQEALNNVERHSRARRAEVIVRRHGRRVGVVINDDGVGFRPEQARRMDAYGLVGMRERAESIGGTLLVESEPGQGTAVTVEVELR